MRPIFHTFLQCYLDERPFFSRWPTAKISLRLPALHLALLVTLKRIFHTNKLIPILHPFLISKSFLYFWIITYVYMYVLPRHVDKFERGAKSYNEPNSIGIQKQKVKCGRSLSIRSIIDLDNIVSSGMKMCLLIAFVMPTF